MIQIPDYPFTKQECVMTEKKHVDREKRPDCESDDPVITTQGFTGNNPDEDPHTPAPPPPPPTK